MIFETIILNALGLKTIEELENTLDLLPPSMAEYEIENSLGESLHVPYGYIERKIPFGRFEVIIDYDQVIYIKDNGVFKDTEQLVF